MLEAPAAAAGSRDHRHHAQPCLGRRAPHDPHELCELSTRWLPAACDSIYRLTPGVLTCHGPGGLGDARLVVSPHLCWFTERRPGGLQVGTCPRGLQNFATLLKHVRFARFQVLNVSTFDEQHVRDGRVPKKRSACPYHAGNQETSCAPPKLGPRLVGSACARRHRNSYTNIRLRAEFRGRRPRYAQSGGGWACVHRLRMP